jgi:hypothetical protein
LKELLLTVLEGAVQGTTARVLRCLGVATALTAVAGCGPVHVTTGTVPGSKDNPHLSRAQFVPTVEQAMAREFSVHASVGATRGKQASTLEADASFRRDAAVRLTMTDGLGIYGAPSVRAKEMRLVGRQVFVPVPHRTGKFSAIDVASPRSRLGRFATLARRAVRPSETFEPIRRGMRSLTYEGMDAGQGLYLDHYQVVVGSARAFGAATAKRMHAPATLTYEVWLDSDGLLRRIAHESGGVAYDTSFIQWGKSVEAEAPPPRDVVRTVRG